MSLFGVFEPIYSLINLLIYFLTWFFIVPYLFKIPEGSFSLPDFFKFIRLEKLILDRRKYYTGLSTGLIFIIALALVSLIFGASINFNSIIPNNRWILLYGSIGAFFEEIAIRGVILGLLRVKYNENKSIFYSAIVIGFIQIFSFIFPNDPYVNSINVIYTFILGMIFGYLAIRTRSIVPGIIAHILINILSSAFISDLSVQNQSNSLFISSIITLVTLNFINSKLSDRFSEHKLN